MTLILDVDLTNDPDTQQWTRSLLPIPLFYQVERAIDAAIARGTFGASGKLWSEEEMCQRFGVSRTTVREAVRRLRDQGRVVTVKGKGTFVAHGRVAS